MTITSQENKWANRINKDPIITGNLGDFLDTRTENLEYTLGSIVRIPTIPIGRAEHNMDDGLSSDNASAIINTLGTLNITAIPVLIRSGNNDRVSHIEISQNDLVKVAANSEKPITNKVNAAAR